MKTKYLIPFVALALFSCDNKEEPIKVIAPKIIPNTQSIKAFKSQKDKQLVIAMHYDWGQKPGYNLINTPDSLDMIVLKNGFEDMTPSKMKDLVSVQYQKLTNVLLSCDIQDYVSRAEKQIKNDYKQAKKVQDKKWSKAAEDKAAGLEVKEQDLRPTDTDAVNAIYAEIKNNITEKAKSDLVKSLNDAKAMLTTYVGRFGFNGFSIKLPYSFDLLSEDFVREFLSSFTSISGKEKPLLLIVENPLIIFTEEVSKANYLVASKPDGNLISTYDEQAKEWINEAYFPSFNQDDTNLSSGFEDSKIFTAGNELSKDKYLIKWTAPNKKGIAVYHSEKMYFDIADIDGYVLPYKSLREFINAVNAK